MSTFNRSSGTLGLPELIRALRREELPFNPLADVPGFIAKNPADLAKLALPSFKVAHPREPLVAVDRIAIAAVARNFHNRIGTLTERVDQNLASLTSGSPIIRIAHQPNLFPSLGIVAQFLFLENFAKELFEATNEQPCQLYFIIDTDSWKDRRYGVAHFPDPYRANGYFALSAPKSDLHPDTINAKCLLFPATCLEGMLSEIEHVTRRDLKTLRRNYINEISPGSTLDHLTAIAYQIRASYECADSLSTFNAGFLSRVVNLHWGLPIAFVPVSKIMPLLVPFLTFLVTHYPLISAHLVDISERLRSQGIYTPGSLTTSEVFPLWYLCRPCDTRIALRVSATQPLVVRGACKCCSKAHEFNVRSFDAPNLNEFEGRALPRVLFDDLLDVVALRIAGGTGYIRNAEHAVLAALVAHRMGWGVPAECLWRPYGVYWGTSECASVASAGAADSGSVWRLGANRTLTLSAEGRATVLYYLLSSGVEGLADAWRDFFRVASSVESVNTTTCGFVVGQEIKERILNEVSNIVAR